MTEQPRPARGHRIPDEQWAKIVADAEQFARQTEASPPVPDEVEVQEDGEGEGPRPRRLVVRRLTPVLDWTAQGRASGKYFPVSGIPTQLIVIHSMECPLAPGYAQSVTKWALPSLAAGGPQASWHRSYGPDYRVYFVPDELGAWHASEANGLSIGLEQTGYAAYSRAQWLTPDGVKMLDSVGYDVASICKRDGIPPVFLSTAQVRAVLDGGNRSIKGICFHRQIDPETRTDPGNGYPADVLLANVKKYLTPAPTKDWFDMATKADLEAVVVSKGWAYKGAGATQDAYAILRNTPKSVWEASVLRGGKKVSVLQEVADSKTLGQANQAAIARLEAKLDAILKAVSAPAPELPKAMAQEDVIVDLEDLGELDEDTRSEDERADDAWQENQRALEGRE